MSNKTIFKVKELKREAESLKQDILDQQQAYESLCEVDQDIITIATEAIEYIDNFIRELPKQEKIREKDVELATLWLEKYDNLMKKTFKASKLFIEKITEASKDLNIGINVDDMTDMMNMIDKELGNA